MDLQNGQLTFNGLQGSISHNTEHITIMVIKHAE
jgi:hypothetical protein